MKRLLVFLLFLANLAALALYLYDYYPVLQDSAVHVPPVRHALDRGVAYLEARSLRPAHAVAGGGGAVLLLGLLALFRRRGRRSQRTSWTLRLFVAGLLAALGGFFAWIATSEEEVIALGPFVLERGPRGPFLAFSLHVFLLVLSAHMLVLLGAALWVSGRKKKGAGRPPARKSKKEA